MRRAIVWAAVSSAPQANEDEKNSIPTQLEQGRAWCVENGYTIIDELIVPGHSRRFYTIAEAAAVWRKKGVYAFDLLLQHIDAHDFDVFVCRDGDRFGRETSIHAEVLNRIIDAGAKIYCAADNKLIDQRDYRFWGLMNAYKSTKDVDDIIARRHMGMTKRAERGLPTGRKPIFSHCIIRDEFGRAQRQIVKPELRPLFDDLATVFLEGVPYGDLSSVLYEQYGHANATNHRPYPKNKFQHLLHSPNFWGHGVYGYRRVGKRHSYGQWTYDPAEMPPDAVLMFPNKTEAVYTGEQAERIKTELRRRSQEMKGNRRPHKTSIFSTLIICGKCFKNLQLKWGQYKQKDYTTGYYGCNHRIDETPVCENRKYIRIDRAIAQVDQLFIQKLVAGVALDEILPHEAPVSLDDAIRTLESEIRNLEAEARELLRKPAIPGLEQIQHDELTAVGELLNTKKRRLADLRRQSEAKTITAVQHASLSVVRGLQRFWEQEEAQINRILSTLLATWRFVMVDGQIVDLINTDGESHIVATPLS